MLFYLIYSAYDKEPSLEKQLCKQLMQNYSNVGLNGRPVSNMSATIAVSFGLGLIQMDLNERDKILSTSMWSRYVSSYLFPSLTFPMKVSVS